MTNGGSTAECPHCRGVGRGLNRDGIEVECHVCGGEGGVALPHVDISEARVKNWADRFEGAGSYETADMLRALREQLTLAQAWVGGYARMEAERDEARAALTAAESRAVMLRQALDVVFTDDSGDLDFIKFKVRQNLPGESL